MKTLLHEDYFLQATQKSDFLFHYTSCSIALEHILWEGQLKFSSLNGSGDPMEFEDYSISAASFAAGDLSVVKRDLEEKNAKGQRLNNLIKRALKVACFCIDSRPEDFVHWKGCYRSRMWTQYAQGHSGVCIAFSKQALLECVRAATNPSDSVLDYEVVYTNDSKELDHILFIRPGNDWPDETELFLSNPRRLAFTKVKDYDNESEYRICYLRRSSHPERNYELVRCESAIAGMIAGSRFSRAYLPSALSLSEKLGIPLFRCWWYHGNPFCEPIRDIGDWK
jgi:hypothetical protein